MFSFELPFSFDKKKILVASLISSLLSGYNLKYDTNDIPVVEFVPTKITKDLSSILNNSNNNEEFIKKLKEAGFSDNERIEKLKEIAKRMHEKYDWKMQRTKKYKELSPEKIFNAIKNMENKEKLAGVCANQSKYLNYLASNLGFKTNVWAGVNKNGVNHTNSVIKTRNGYELIDYGYHKNLGKTLKRAKESWEEYMSDVTFLNNQITSVDKNYNEYSTLGELTDAQKIGRKLLGVDSDFGLKFNFSEVIENNRKIGEGLGLVSRKTYSSFGNLDNGSYIGLRYFNSFGNKNALHADLSLNLGILDYKILNHLKRDVYASLKTKIEFSKKINKWNFNTGIKSLAIYGIGLNKIKSVDKMDGIFTNRFYSGFEYEISDNDKISLSFNKDFSLKYPLGNQYKLYFNLDKSFLKFSYFKRITKKELLITSIYWGKNKNGLIKGLGLKYQKNRWNFVFDFNERKAELGAKIKEVSGKIKYKKDNLNFVLGGQYLKEKNNGSDWKVYAGISMKY